MENVEFLKNGKHPYMLWLTNDHKIPDTLRVQQLWQFYITEKY